MKYSAIIFSIIVSWMTAIPSFGSEPREITMEEALIPVKSYFSGKDALYYLMKNDSSVDSDNTWRFFVDLAPGYGWSMIVVWWKCQNL